MMDQQIISDISDARVKIVIGRFILNAVQFAVLFTFFLLLTIRPIFNVAWDQSDAWLMMMWTRIGLPAAAAIVIIGYFVNYRPKKAKLELYREHLVLYKKKFMELQISQDSKKIYCFSIKGSIDLKSIVKYHVWKEEGHIYLFPVKPEIETLDTYITLGVPYVMVKIDESLIDKAHYSGPWTYTRYSYDLKKKLKTTSETMSRTVTIHVSNPGKPAGVYVFDPGFDEIVGIAEETLAEETQKQKPATDPVDTMKSRLEKLKKLHEDGLINDEEFQSQRKKILDQSL